MVKKRTSVNWNEHELKITKSEGLLIHELKKPNTFMQSIKFINTSGIMAVTGDYGNWIFCREFHPSADGFVSDHYWLEKCKIASSQEPTKFDSVATKKLIEEGLNGKLVEWGFTGDNLSEVKEYYTELLDYVEYSAWEYESFAYTNLPTCIDAEDVPMVKDTKTWLKITFDAFDEICQRLKNKDEKK